MSGVRRAVGGALVALPLLPLHGWLSRAPGSTGLVTVGTWLFGLATFGVLAGLLAALAGERLDGPARRLAAGAVRRPAAAFGAAAALLAILLTLVSAFAYAFGPVTVDGIVQLFQARLVAAGRAVAPAPSDPAAFLVTNTGIGPVGWFAQYPPGHPVGLAAGVLVGAPWAVPVALTVGAFAALVDVARRAWGPTEAAWTALLLLTSPFLLFVGTSFLSHPTTLFLVAVFLALFLRWEAEGSTLAAGAAGLALGLAFLARPWTAVAVGVPFAAYAAATARREGRWASAAVGAAVLLATTATLLAWNAATTGDPWTPGYVALWGDAHGLGFHATPYGEVHTPLLGLRNELLDLSLLQAMLFEWPVPGLWPLGLLFALGWDGDRWERRLLWAFLAIPAAYVFYWHRDALLGPRFLYASIAFVVPLTARAIVVGGRRLAGRCWTLGDFPPLRAATAAGVLLALCLAWTVGYAIPKRTSAYASAWPSVKVDLAARAREAGIERGVVLVPVSWGNRVISRLRAAGVPAAVAEAAYRGADHCDLEAIADRARSEGWPADRVTTAVVAADSAADTVAYVPLNGDPTLRLSPARIRVGPGGTSVDLPPACATEIEYDARGYTVYVPHVVANAPGLDGPLVVARDLRDDNARLLEAYADRPVFVWRNGRFEPLEEAP